MPNYYAHLEFGRRVLEALPPALRRSVEREKDAFEVGLYGPDPLFFYYPIPHSAVRRAGIETHHRAARVPMERLLHAARTRQSMALGYGAGLLCHYALDSACHPIIHALCNQGDLTHGAMEAELDRRLMEQTRLDPLHDTPMPARELEERVYEAAVCAYPEISPRQFRQALELFGRGAELLTRAGGTRIRDLAEGLARRYPALSRLHGMVLQAQPDSDYDGACQRLTGVLLELVEPTTGQIAGFLAAIQTPKLRLSDWYNRDFDGRVPREESSAEFVPGAAGVTG